MATNEEAEEGEVAPTRSEVLGRVVARATDTGSQTGMSLRVWVILAGLAIVVAVAVPPLNVMGTILLVALALTLASRTRTPR